MGPDGDLLSGLFFVAGEYGPAALPNSADLVVAGEYGTAALP